MPTSEDQLRAWMIAGLDGDAVAHAAMLGALVPILRAYFRRRFRDEDGIEDLVQETLIAIHTRRASYDRERPFGPWLFAVARHKMLDQFRRSRTTRAVDDLGDHLAVDGFEDASNASMDLERLLETLPDKQADAIRHTRLDGFSVAEAAAAMSIGESDVKVSVHRGLKTLAARLRGGRP